MSDTFDDLENTRLADVKEPAVLPEGTWRFIVRSGTYKAIKSDNPNAPKKQATFMVKAIEPGDDVPDVLLEDLRQEDIESARVSHRVPIFEVGDEWNVRRFLAMIGVDIDSLLADDPDMTLVDACKHAKGYEFTAFVKHSPNPKDQDHPYVNLEDVQPVD